MSIFVPRGSGWVYSFITRVAIGVGDGWVHERMGEMLPKIQIKDQ